MRSRGCWDAPGAVQEGVAQRGEDGDVMRPGGGDVGTDAAEGLEPAHAPPAPADLRLELGHPDRLLAAVVGPVDVEVGGEVQHLVDPLGHPFGQLVGLLAGVKGASKEAYKLAKRMAKRIDQVLYFSADSDVDWTNNSCEQAIRMAKLQAKISGSWRSMRGLKAFCRIRSYIATARAHDVPVFTALPDAFLDSPWSIPATA